MGDVTNIIGSLSTAAQQWYHTINPGTPVYTVQPGNVSGYGNVVPLPQTYGPLSGANSTQTVLLIGAGILLVIVLLKVR